MQPTYSAEPYPWLTPLYDKWRALSEADKVAHAILCSAPDGYGISQLAQWFSHTLVCQRSKSDPCGFCHSCELNHAGNHPDIHWIKPEKEGKSISVEQIRLCNQWALESSHLGGNRIIIIEPAEAMNQSASNALLKTLESPPDHCIFLLLANNKNRLLPTIISRCQKWEINQTSSEHSSEHSLLWLQQQTDKQVSHNTLRLCGGAPLKALAFVEQGLHDRFVKMEECFYLLVTSEYGDETQLWLSVKDNMPDALGWLSLLLSDIQKSHFAIVEQGMCSRSEELAKSIPYHSAYRAMIKLNQLRQQLVEFSGLNAELLLMNWLIELKEDICL